MQVRKWLGLVPRQTQPHPEDGHLFFRWWCFESAFWVSAATVKRLRHFRLLLTGLFISFALLIMNSFPERCATLNPLWWCNLREVSLWSLPVLAAVVYHHGTRRILMENERTHVRLSLCGRMAGQGFSGVGRWCSLLAIFSVSILWLSVLDWWLFEQPVLEYYGLAGSAHLGTIALIGIALEDTFSA